MLNLRPHRRLALLGRLFEAAGAAPASSPHATRHRRPGAGSLRRSLALARSSCAPDPNPADVRLHPELPLLAASSSMHLRVPCAAPVLRRRGASMMLRQRSSPCAAMAARRQVRTSPRPGCFPARPRRTAAPRRRRSRRSQEGLAVAFDEEFRKACLCHGSIFQSATPAQLWRLDHLVPPGEESFAPDLYAGVRRSRKPEPAASRAATCRRPRPE